jgi:hypothetical protein
MRRRAHPGRLSLLALVLLLVPAAGVATGAERAATSATAAIAITPEKVPSHWKPGARQAAVKELQRGASRSFGRSEVGDEKVWLALDFTPEGGLYLKEYTLRGVGEHIEVWVASGSDDVSTGTDFLPGDCRNGEPTTITDDQVQYLIDQYDSNILPTESEAFSVAPDRGGENAQLDDILPELGLPADYWTGEGDDVVALIDNVRDENFFDKNLAGGSLTYTAGFFSGTLNELFDRNVMTIDAFDWLHRTGANPPNDPDPDDPCSSFPARPFQYEGTFAHEYEHLLEYYEDSDEVSWVDEGLADYAQTITGYKDLRLPITEIGADRHVQCFLGWLSTQTPANPQPLPGGPENSLTIWGDRADEILCDYGAAYTFMEYLAGQFGHDFLTALHREDANGLAGLRALLRGEAGGPRALAVIHRWLAMTAVDGVLDDGADLTGGRAARYTTPTLDASIDWDNPKTHAEPGAPPNGGDFVRVRDASGAYLDAGAVESISFDADELLPPLPVEWVVDESPPDHGGDPALYTGDIASNIDRAIIAEAVVPEADPTLRFETRWDTEPGFDSAFVQVSTDGGESWTSLGNEDTTTELDPQADQVLVENLPGFNGSSDGWRSEEFDLAEWAGQTVLLSFRYITDVNTEGLGWWIDDVTLGGDDPLTDGTSLAGFQSLTEVNPIEVQGFTVQLVAYTDDGEAAWVGRVPLADGFSGELSGQALRHEIGDRAETVAAIVTYDENAETIVQYAPYRLEVNGVLQPGGGTEPTG